jgi:DNA-binding response OmpR family regulator
MYISRDDQDQGMTTGADAYMVAPVDPEALLATLDHLIADRGPVPQAH